MLCKPFLIVLCFISCVGGKKSAYQKRFQAYDVPSQIDSTVHYFIHLPRADSAGRFHDTLISLPSEKFPHVFLSFESGGEKSDVFISGTNQITFSGLIGFNDCEGGGAGSQFGRHIFDTTNQSEKRFIACRLKRPEPWYIHYISSTRHGYYRLIIR